MQPGSTPLAFLGTDSRRRLSLQAGILAAGGVLLLLLATTVAFLLQAEYRQFVIFMDTNDNEVINEWTVGFTHFF